MAKIGLQLYSVKERCAEDFFGTLDEVAKSGYDGVEFAGYYDKTSQELNRKLKDIGLAAAGSHISIEQLEQSLDEIIEFSHNIESLTSFALDYLNNTAIASMRTNELVSYSRKSEKKQLKRIFVLVTTTTILN